MSPCFGMKQNELFVRLLFIIYLSLWASSHKHFLLSSLYLSEFRAIVLCHCFLGSVLLNCFVCDTLWHFFVSEHFKQMNRDTNSHFQCQNDHFFHCVVSQQQNAMKCVVRFCLANSPLLWCVMTKTFIMDLDLKLVLLEFWIWFWVSTAVFRPA